MGEPLGVALAPGVGVNAHGVSVPIPVVAVAVGGADRVAESRGVAVWVGAGAVAISSGVGLSGTGWNMVGVAMPARRSESSPHPAIKSTTHALRLMSAPLPLTIVDRFSVCRPAGGRPTVLEPPAKSQGHADTTDPTCEVAGVGPAVSV